MSDIETTGTETTEENETEDTVTLEEELIADLKAELSITDELFKETLLTVKVKNAIREVKQLRNYPSDYTDTQLEDDLMVYYSNIRKLALYDYNTVGMEFQSASSEDNTSRTMFDRNTCFNGIRPLPRFD